MSKAVLINAARLFFRINRQISNSLDNMLPERLRRDGNTHFKEQVIPSILRDGATIYDIGGGSQPCITLDEKRSRNITLIGLDISEDEMAAAPTGLYDQTIIADLTRYTGNNSADITICQAVLEHVADNRQAISAISTIMQPGGGSKYIRSMQECSLRKAKSCAAGRGEELTAGNSPSGHHRAPGVSCALRSMHTKADDEVVCG